LHTPVSATARVASADATQNQREGDKMSNFLDMRCPKCGGEDRIDIEAKVWVRVTDNGTDADASECGDHNYTPESAALCGVCGHWSTVREFEGGDQ
jgi:hypothetical protein